MDDQRQPQEDGDCSSCKHFQFFIPEDMANISNPALPRMKQHGFE